MRVTRQYYNSVDTLLRTDELEVRVTTHSLLYCDSLILRLTPRTLKTTISKTGTIDHIYINGDYTLYDDSGPSYNYSWVKKTLGNGQDVIINMSDLPEVGDGIIVDDFGFGHVLFGHSPFGGS